MYTKIVNPITGRLVSITSRKGKNIIKNYITYLQGGADTMGGENLSERERLAAQLKSISELTNKIAQLKKDLIEAQKLELECQRKVSSCNGNLIAAQEELEEVKSDLEIAEGGDELQHEEDQEKIDTLEKQNKVLKETQTLEAAAEQTSTELNELFG